MSVILQTARCRRRIVGSKVWVCHIENRYQHHQPANVSVERVLVKTKRNIRGGSKHFCCFCSADTDTKQISANMAVAINIIWQNIRLVIVHSRPSRKLSQSVLFFGCPASEIRHESLLHFGQNLGHQPAEPASPRACGGPRRILLVFEPFSRAEVNGFSRRHEGSQEDRQRATKEQRSGRNYPSQEINESSKMPKPCPQKKRLGQKTTTLLRLRV